MLPFLCIMALLLSCSDDFDNNVPNVEEKSEVNEAVANLKAVNVLSKDSFNFFEFKNVPDTKAGLAGVDTTAGIAAILNQVQGVTWNIFLNANITAGTPMYLGASSGTEAEPKLFSQPNPGYTSWVLDDGNLYVKQAWEDRHYLVNYPFPDDSYDPLPFICPSSDLLLNNHRWGIVQNTKASTYALYFQTSQFYYPRIYLSAKAYGNSDVVFSKCIFR